MYRGEMQSKPKHYFDCFLVCVAGCPVNGIKVASVGCSVLLLHEVIHGLATGLLFGSLTFGCDSHKTSETSGCTFGSGALEKQPGLTQDFSQLIGRHVHGDQAKLYRNCQYCEVCVAADQRELEPMCRLLAVAERRMLMGLSPIVVCGCKRAKLIVSNFISVPYFPSFHDGARFSSSDSMKTAINNCKASCSDCDLISQVLRACFADRNASQTHPFLVFFLRAMEALRSACCV